MKAILRVPFVAACLALMQVAPGQTPPDTTAPSRTFRGTVQLTNNGISLVPSFSLNRPALLALMAVGGKRFTFEPDLRIGLDGKPWSALFWFRYRAVRRSRFSLRVGAHPALNFRTLDYGDDVDTGPREVIEARRFLAAELVPSWRLGEPWSVGGYYLYGRGFDNSQRVSHFAVANVGLARVPLGERLDLSVYPNAYYLVLDELDGWYASATVRVGLREKPWSVSAVANQTIDTEILPEQRFVWNVALEWSFRQEYVPLRLPL